MHEEQIEWTEIIEPKAHLFDLKLKEVWRYRDLLVMLVRRDFVATYKQTILGPIWFFIQPLLTTITYMLIFGNIAKISTDGLPMAVFYMAGITIWNYYADSLNKTATVFKDNATIFGKVYFPRLIMPLSIVVSNLVRLGIQLSLFILIWGYYFFAGAALHPNSYLLLVPVVIVLMALQALGLGMMISALTTKYRDLVFLLTFGVQLLMYATPVIYPMSALPAKYATLIRANPLSEPVELFRYAFTGSGQISWGAFGYSVASTLVLLTLGTLIFNRVERRFMDTV
ncbi:MAG: ABC transporter permease [Sphingobacteriales bacterium]|uniref:ABC transporter permease n=1 Tax=Hydrotalea flava TaxID=714549 RepID=UPI000829AD79|nr:ABC transporter permease [Hydrotalea flava]RTL49099.1 MAG: ABC transporter permease [Sphingobacteriales bacterium]